MGTRETLHQTVAFLFLGTSEKELHFKNVKFRNVKIKIKIFS